MEKHMQQQKQRSPVLQQMRTVVPLGRGEPAASRLALERKIATLQHRLSQREHEVWTLRRLLLYH